jgi:hypothetical protein
VRFARRSNVIAALLRFFLRVALVVFCIVGHWSVPDHCNCSYPGAGSS